MTFLKNAKSLGHKADNCVAQNKNNAVMQYFFWRVLQNLNTDIEISFMIAGHTKFDCDRGFGLIKKKFLITDCETILDIKKIVESSSSTNFAQLIRDPKSKEVLVPFHKWTEFFNKFFIKINSITNYHHFRFSSNLNGLIEVREYYNSTPILMNIFIKDLTLESFPFYIKPEIFIPEDLPLSRQIYLYKNIRTFCSNQFNADLTCPKPTNFHVINSNIKIKRKHNSVKLGKKLKVC